MSYLRFNDVRALLTGRPVVPFMIVAGVALALLLVWPAGVGARQAELADSAAAKVQVDGNSYARDDSSSVLSAHVSAGPFQTCALRPDGSPLCWGWDNVGQSSPPDDTFTQITAGGGNGCGLRVDGTVSCWGTNNNNQLTTIPTDTFKQVRTGLWFACGLKTDNTIACWGRNLDGEGSPPPDTFIQLDTGDNHTCGVKTDGTLACWGRNNFNQATAPGGNNFAQVSGGTKHSCAVKTDGTAVCWGLADDGRTTVPTDTYTAVAAGYDHTCALKTDKTVACWGLNDVGQTDAPTGIYNEISAYGSHTCALRTDGILVCWGLNEDGQTDDKDGLFGPTGLIEIGQRTDPAGLTDSFSFTATSPLTPTFSLSDGMTETIEVAIGTHTMTQAAPAGFTLSDISCGEGGVGDTASAGVVITVTEGATVSCTFLNTRPSTTAYYVSTWTAGTVNDLSYGPHDILQWDADAESWSKWFDGAAAGLLPDKKFKHNINSIWISDTESTEFAVSFAQNQQKIGALGMVDGYDILWWDGSAFSRWFEGEKVGLNVKAQEKIDALHVLPAAPVGSSLAGEPCEAYLLISTHGPGQVKTGLPGPANVLKFRGEDILGFCATNLGVATTGLWEMVLDGSAMLPALPPNSVDSLSVSPDGTKAYATVRRQMPLDSQVFVYDLAAGTVSGPILNFADIGLTSPVDGLQVVGEPALP